MERLTVSTKAPTVPKGSTVRGVKLVSEFSIFKSTSSCLESHLMFCHGGTALAEAHELRVNIHADDVLKEQPRKQLVE